MFFRDPLNSVYFDNKPMRDHNQENTVLSLVSSPEYTVVKLTPTVSTVCVPLQVVEEPVPGDLGPGKELLLTPAAGQHAALAALLPLLTLTLRKNSATVNESH